MTLARGYKNFSCSFQSSPNLHGYISGRRYITWISVWILIILASNKAYILNQCMDLHQTCTATSMGAGLSLETVSRSHQTCTAISMRAGLSLETVSGSSPNLHYYISGRISVWIITNLARLYQWEEAYHLNKCMIFTKLA